MNWNIAIIFGAILVFSVGAVFISRELYRALLRMFRS